MKAVVTFGVLRFALLFVTTSPVSATAATTIPLVEGLTLVRAASERQGDYESTLTINGLDAQGMLHLNISADLPDPSGGKAKAVTFDRDVSADDREHARTYKYLFSMGAQAYPGTTAMGVSGDVIRDLRARGKASITLDGQLGGLAGLFGGILEGIPGADSDKRRQVYLSAQPPFARHSSCSTSLRSVSWHRGSEPRSRVTPTQLSRGVPATDESS
jgi:hypothetical protein